MSLRVGSHDGEPPYGELLYGEPPYGEPLYGEPPYGELFPSRSRSPSSTKIR
jgi:hypothetical protein